MTYKVSALDEHLHRKAKKMTSDQKRLILNTKVKEDIIEDLTSEFRDLFVKKTTIAIVDGTTEYALPTDYGKYICITDSGGKVLPVESGFADDARERVEFSMVSGLKKINTIASTTLTSIKIEYELLIKDVENETDDIPYPEFMVNKSFLDFLGMMISYYYLLEKKKYDEAGVLLQVANQMRANLFDVAGVTSF